MTCAASHTDVSKTEIEQTTDLRAKSVTETLEQTNVRTRNK